MIQPGTFTLAKQTTAAVPNCSTQYQTIRPWSICWGWKACRSFTAMCCWSVLHNASINAWKASGPFLCRISKSLATLSFDKVCTITCSLWCDVMVSLWSSLSRRSEPSMSTFSSRYTQFSWRALFSVSFIAGRSILITEQFLASAAGRWVCWKYWSCDNTTHSKGEAVDQSYDCLVASLLWCKACGSSGSSAKHAAKQDNRIRVLLTPLWRLSVLFGDGHHALLQQYQQEISCPSV